MYSNKFLDTIPCNETRFKTTSQQAKTLGIYNGFFCPNEVDFAIRGAASSDAMSYL